ncbi:MAG: diguanylate cyclase [Terasakiella sp.]|uniref:diguanylate cyclase n=1 Tax=unclassified Terasakiella TaxID=2614952 RepID=UPI003AFFB5AE
MWDIARTFEGCEILVVDDNLINLKVLTQVLSTNGYVVRGASSGEEAFFHIKEKTPDLILLDVQMPGLDGFEVCQQLKGSPETADVPVIFITATDTVESKIKGFEVGASDYIPRPLQMPEVLARVKNQLTARQFYRQVEDEKERLEKVLSALPVPYLLSSIDTGMLIEMNDHACAVLEIAQKDVKRTHAKEIYAFPEMRTELLKKLKQSKLISNEELDLKKSSGEVFTALFSATPLRLLDENVFFIAFNDIAERKKMEQALEEAARTDYLTGTLNRRALSARAIDEKQRSKRNKKPISILMLDIDHFKKINDTFGHEVGDDALKELVALIGETLRTSDALGRIGGEEFVLLLPETSFEGAKVLAERIRTRIENNVLKTADGKELTMTVSGGLAEWATNQSYEEVLKLTDERLYKAKNTGRNRIISD